MQLTTEQKAILEPAVYSTWSYIQCDMPEDISNPEAIEMVIDADRMGTQGFPEAQTLVRQLLEDNTVDEVFEVFNKSFALIW